MANNKNQHFIPQFYLRRFSGDGRSVSLQHLASGRFIHTAPIKDQCSKSYLYGKDAQLEEEIQNLEIAGSTAIRAVLDRLQPPPLRSAEATTLMVYLYFQWARTPTAAQELDAYGHEMARRLSALPDSSQDENLKTQIEVLRAGHPNPIWESLKISFEIGPSLLDLHSKLVINESAVEFVTSDVAVVFHNQWCEAIQEHGTTGFASKGLQIFFPLSPRHLLVYFDASVYKVGNRSQNVVRFSDAKEVECLNSLQREAAHHNLYFSGDSRTQASLATMSGPRAPRHLQLGSYRAVEQGGKRELVYMYFRPSQVQLQLSWLRVSTRARRIPDGERLDTWRPRAVAIHEFLHGAPALPYGLSAEQRRNFRRIDEG